MHETDQTDAYKTFVQPKKEIKKFSTIIKLLQKAKPESIEK